MTISAHLRRLMPALFTACVASTTALAATPPDCESLPKLALDKIDARVIVVGESHGTVEVPAFVGQVACNLLRQGRPVIVALERDDSEQASLDKYIQSQGRAEDVKALLATGAWARPKQQDGRSSQAMLALIEQLRQWRQDGQRVGVLAMQMEFHEIAPLTAAERVPVSSQDVARFSLINDRSMADKTWATMVLHTGYTVVALAGNVHTALGSKERAKFESTPSFADVLASYTPIHIIGLNSQGGSTWNITSKGMGPRSAVAGPLFIQDAHIDTQVDVGKITASPPAASAP